MVLLLAAFMAIMMVCGFMVMVWGMILFGQQDYEAGKCHLSIVSFDSLSGTTTQEAILTPARTMTPGGQRTRYVTP